MSILIGSILPTLASTPTPPATRRRYLLGSILSTLVAGAPGSFPYGLPEAIAYRFGQLSGSILSGLTAIYESAAGSSPTMPYVVFTITSAGMEVIFDESQWDDHRVKFEVFATSQVTANSLRDAVASTVAYGGQSLSFSSGVMTPLVRLDRVENREKSRAPGSTLTFKAAAFFQTRVRSDF